MEIYILFILNKLLLEKNLQLITLVSLFLPLSVCVLLFFFLLVLADNLKSNPGIKWQYFSSEEGIFTVFPAHKFHCKSTYEHRSRCRNTHALTQTLTWPHWLSETLKVHYQSTDLYKKTQKATSGEDLVRNIFTVRSLISLLHRLPSVWNAKTWSLFVLHLGHLTERNLRQMLSICLNNHLDHITFSLHKNTFPLILGDFPR